jgi:predicted permease
MDSHRQMMEDPTRFGNTLRLREEAGDAWGWRWADDLSKDLRYAAARIVKNPIVALFTIMTVALGIGASTAMFSVVDAVLLEPIGFDDSNRVVALWESNPKRNIDAFDVSVPNFQDWRNQNSVFDSMAAYERRSVTLAGQGDPVGIPAVNVTGEFFEVVKTQAQFGRTLSAADAQENPSVVVISHDLWASRFDRDPSVVGRDITLDGIHYSVAGVTRKGFDYPDTSVWIPMQLPETSRGRGFLTVIARLADGVSLETASAQMKTIASRLAQEYPTSNESWTVTLSYLRDDIVKNLRSILVVLSGAVAFLMLIACTNVAGLQLAQCSRRQREVAVRASLGGGRMRILRQLLTENILLSILGGIVGIVFAYVALKLLLVAAPANLPRVQDAQINWRVLAFGFTLSLVTGVSFGLLPALELLKGNPNDRLRNSSQSVTAGFSNHRLRSAVLVAQLALTVVVLSGAGLMISSLNRLYSVDAGFVAAHVLTVQVNLPEKSYDSSDRSIMLVERLTERFRQIPGVTAVATTNSLPLSLPALDQAQPELGFHLEGERRSAQARFVTAEYFRVLRIPIVSGRAFTPADGPNAPRVVIVNESFVREFLNGRPTSGTNIEVGGTTYEIVGIVRDTRDEGLHVRPRPMYFLPLLQQSSNVNSLIASIRFLIRTSNVVPGSIAGDVRSNVKAIDPGLAVSDIHTMEEIGRLSLSRTRFATEFLVVFALSGLLLAAVGVYGVVASFVGQRTREFAVRVALGAETRDILARVLHPTIKVCAMGAAIGVFGEWALSTTMRSVVFEVSAADPAILFAAVLILVAVALLASLLPARHAIRTDAAVCLRHE